MGSTNADVKLSRCQWRWIVGSFMALGCLLLGVTYSVQYPMSVTSLAAKGTTPVISDPGIFERLQHFKDVGIPATTSNPLARACISYGVCMLFDASPDGLFNLKHTKAADAILSGVTALPSSDTPSYLTLHAKQTMPLICSKATSNGGNALQGFAVADVSDSLDNWHRALCADKNEPSWKGAYDPAYQPQQKALTAGLTCTFVCELAGQHFHSSQLAGAVVGSYCSAFPWGKKSWKDASSFTDLASIATTLSSVCGCE